MLIKQSSVPYHMDSRVPLCLYHWLNLPKTRNWRAWAVFSCRPLRQLSAVVCPSLALANRFQRMTATFRCVQTLVHWPLTVACLQSSARELCTCAILSTEVSILCFCSAWWSLPSPDNADEWESGSAVRVTIRGPLISCKSEFGVEKEVFDRLQHMFLYPGTLLISWRQELRKGNTCIPKF
jgi:hypothetical protein